MTTYFLLGFYEGGGLAHSKNVSTEWDGGLSLDELAGFADDCSRMNIKRVGFLTREEIVDILTERARARGPAQREHILLENDSLISFSNHGITEIPLKQEYLNSVKRANKKRPTTLRTQ